MKPSQGGKQDFEYKPEAGHPGAIIGPGVTRFEDMRKKGTIRSWNEQKAFGFIKPVGGGKEVFLHVSGLGNRSRQPEVGQSVSYVMSTDKQGRPCAAQALLPGDRLANKVTKVRLAGAVSIAAIFLSAVLFLCSKTGLPVFVFWVYLAVSVVTFLVYAFDKAAARADSRRTPENTLHLLAIAGGWPGALIAQQALRHKSRKQPFRFVFWVTVLINCGALLWLFTPDGGRFLQMQGSATIEWAE